MNAFSRAHPEHFWKDPREHNGTSVNIAYGSTPTGCTCSWGFWQGVGWEGRGKKISWKVPFYSVHRDGNMVVSILVKCPHLMATWLGALKNLSKFTSSETYESFVELIFFFFFLSLEVFWHRVFSLQLAISLISGQTLLSLDQLPAFISLLWPNGLLVLPLLTAWEGSSQSGR